jgi:hypothetical protein
MLEQLEDIEDLKMLKIFSVQYSYQLEYFLKLLLQIYLK